MFEVGDTILLYNIAKVTVVFKYSRNDIGGDRNWYLVLFQNGATMSIVTGKH